MRRALTAVVLVALASAPLLAASDQQPAPAGTLPGSPPQFTRFSVDELKRGFMALAFGSDLQLGTKPRGIRRFGNDIRVFVAEVGRFNRKAAMDKIIAEYGAVIPRLKISAATNEDDANLVVHLINNADFKVALIDALGGKTARAFVKKTHPQCMTSVTSGGDGAIVRAVSFVIIDKGDVVFFDCAYHEMLHAFGLPNHDHRNPWTSLNKNRLVGYLSIYDRALLTLLYDPHIRAGMNRAEAARVLPELIDSLKLATGK